MSSCAAGLNGACGNCTTCAVGASKALPALRSVSFADERQEKKVARLWLVDSGTFEHLTCRASLPREAAPWVEPAANPVVLETANGEFEARESVLLGLDRLKE